MAIGVRAGIVRVSVGLLGWYRLFFIIGGGGRSCLRLRWVLLWLFVGFALTAGGAFVWMGDGTGIGIVRGLGYLKNCIACVG